MGRLAAPSVSDRVRLPPGWTGAVAAHVGANLATFSGSALASAAWGLSMLGHKARPQVGPSGRPLDLRASITWTSTHPWCDVM
jgi:hypothetical protein